MAIIKPKRYNITRDVTIYVYRRYRYTDCISLDMECVLELHYIRLSPREFQDRITSLSKFLNHKSDTQFYVSDKPPCIVCRKDFQHIPLFDNGIPFDF
jgi:phage tail sheath gpL-like